MVVLVKWRGWDRVSVDSGPASIRLMTPPVDSHYRLQICESYSLHTTRHFHHHQHGSPWQAGEKGGNKFYVNFTIKRNTN